MKKEKEKKLPQSVLTKKIAEKAMSVNQPKMPFLYFSLSDPPRDYVAASQKKPLYRLIKVKN